MVDGLIPPHRCGERAEDGSFDLHVVAGEREGRCGVISFESEAHDARRLIV